MKPDQEASVQLDEVRLSLPGPSGQVDILKGISFSLRAGKSLGVMGPSGAGKTTLLMVAAGLERPSSGRVRIMGRDISAMTENSLALFRRGRVGVVFQSFNLVPSLTAAQNVALALELGGQARARQTALDWLDAVGLAHRARHYPAQLSGGEQQRVALARAFAPRPGLILADEPTGSLDESTGAQVAGLLFDMQRREQCTLIIATHRAGLAGRCDLKMSMADGRLIGDSGGDPL